jgi:hypothetical protein
MRVSCSRRKVSYRVITSVTSATIVAASGWGVALGAGGAILVIGLLIALELIGTGHTRFLATLQTALKIAVSPLLVVFAVSVAAKALTALGT